MNTRYLKAPNPPTTGATEELRARVSEILKVDGGWTAW